jgi:hypothetical protein
MIDPRKILLYIVYVSIGYVATIVTIDVIEDEQPLIIIFTC